MHKTIQNRIYSMEDVYQSKLDYSEQNNVNASTYSEEQIMAQHSFESDYCMWS